MFFRTRRTAGLRGWRPTHAGFTSFLAAAAGVPGFGMMAATIATEGGRDRGPYGTASCAAGGAALPLRWMRHGMPALLAPQPPVTTRASGRRSLLFVAARRARSSQGPVLSLFFCVRLLLAAPWSRRTYWHGALDAKTAQCRANRRPSACRACKFAPETCHGRWQALQVVRAFITATALCGSNPARHHRFWRLHLRAILILSSARPTAGRIRAIFTSALRLPMPIPLGHHTHPATCEVKGATAHWRPSSSPHSLLSGPAFSA